MQVVDIIHHDSQLVDQARGGYEEVGIQRKKRECGLNTVKNGP